MGAPRKVDVRRFDDDDDRGRLVVVEAPSRRKRSRPGVCGGGVPRQGPSHAIPGSYEVGSLAPPERSEHRAGDGRVPCALPVFPPDAFPIVVERRGPVVVVVLLLGEEIDPHGGVGARRPRPVRRRLHLRNGGECRLLRRGIVHERHGDGGPLPPRRFVVVVRRRRLAAGVPVAAGSVGNRPWSRQLEGHGGARRRRRRVPVHPRRVGLRRGRRRRCRRRRRRCLRRRRHRCTPE
mmetsp:Transcript_32292/g.67714  ORF Transcript_32292/g.67714 Transcript_32292/m.67714 type:complete len:235 (+) Transcript_32292:1173-1877(+)